MKKIATIWVFLLLTLPVAYGQDGRLFHSDFEQHAFSIADPHQIFSATNPEVDRTKYNEYQREFSSLLEKLEIKKEKWEDFRTIEKLFYTIHKKQLKRYEQYASFGDVIASGKYDCVSGTACLALSLSELDYDYTIFEFDYHTFLIVNLPDGRSVLLESTDPMNGVVTDPQEIEKRITLYGTGGDISTEEIQPVASKTDKQPVHINNQINLLQLAGLQYFNLSVKQFNEGNRHQAAELIEKAYMLYPSERITEVRKIFYAPQLITTR